MSTGGLNWPVLEIVQPLAVFSTSTCSRPIGTDRRKIVKPDGAAVDCVVTGCCARAGAAAADTSAASNPRAVRPARLEWERPIDVSIASMIPPASVEAYAAAQQGCAMADRVDRGWVVVSGA